MGKNAKLIQKVEAFREELEQEMDERIETLHRPELLL